MCNNNTRWWPLWYVYCLDENNISGCGARIVSGFNRKPNPKNYILWTDSVHLTDPSCFIHGLFNFDPRSGVIRLKHMLFLVIRIFFSIVVPLWTLFILFFLLLQVQSLLIHTKRKSNCSPFSHLFASVYICFINCIIVRGIILRDALENIYESYKMVGIKK